MTDTVTTSRPRRPVVAWTAWRPPLPALSAALTSITAALLIGGLVAARANSDSWASLVSDFGLGDVTVSLSFAAVGGLVAVRRPSNTVGWLFVSIGLLAALDLAATQYAVLGLVTAPHSWPLPDVAWWVASWVWFPLFAPFALVMVLFPDGRVVSRPWRWLVRLVVLLCAVGTACLALLPTTRAAGLPDLPNPLGWSGGGTLLARTFDDLVTPVLGPVLVACAVALFVRRRRVPGQREQVTWFMATAAFSVTLYLTAVAMGLAPLGFLVAWPIVAATTGAAILRTRLWDIDVVLSRTVMLGLMVSVVTGVYVAVVVGVGALVGRPGAGPLLVAAVTACAALLLQPLRQGAQRVATRIVYGRRLAPYEALARFSALAAEVGPGPRLLTGLAELAGLGTGAEAASVWLRVADHMRRSARWATDPSAGEGDGPWAGDVVAVAADGSLPHPVSDERVVIEPVRHDGELLGAVTVRTSRNDRLTAPRRRLLADLSAQAGLAMRNLRLTAELQQRAHDLRASRSRLATAQDEERRRIERDLHDGAQQQLMSLKLRIGTLRAMVERADQPVPAAEVGHRLALLGGQADEAIDTLRDLARGIYPAALSAEGLGVALRAQGRRAPIPVQVDVQDGVRYPENVEAAVYFCCLEAVANAAKHAGASRATIRLELSDGTLTFEVADDGAGFDPATVVAGSGLANMRDRVEAAGGQLRVVSRPGTGTRIVGKLPVVVG